MGKAGFEFYTAARIVFGEGTVDRLAEIVPALGSKAVLVVGRQSADRSGLLARLQRELPVAAVAHCEREPRVEDVDAVVAEARSAACDVVVAVGGGSVLDCGKAAAGMITNAGSLVDYLEGVGSGRQIETPPAPLVAVPTTAGTGSEVTKNAVISGPGYKKSIRSPLLIPDVALVDPALTLTNSLATTAACGMDALTQLVEAYLSNNASPLTDGLTLQGISAAASLATACEQPDDVAARSQMALASLLGGICLANAGLGAVHGFASPIGAHFPIGHGEACAALLPAVLQANLDASAETSVGQRVHDRLVRAGRALTGDAVSTPIEAIDAVKALHARIGIRSLQQLGIARTDFARIVAGSRGSSMRYNPVELTDEQLLSILEAAF